MAGYGQGRFRGDESPGLNTCRRGSFVARQQAQEPPSDRQNPSIIMFASCVTPRGAPDSFGPKAVPSARREAGY